MEGFEEQSKEKLPSDEELIARFQQGDVYAFDLIVKRYKQQLLNFVFRFLNNRELAEDVVQETFLRVYRKRHAYKQVAKFSTWIYTIAGNLSRTELRRRKRRKLFSSAILVWKRKISKLPVMNLILKSIRIPLCMRKSSNVKSINFPANFERLYCFGMCRA